MRELPRERGIKNTCTSQDTREHDAQTVVAMAGNRQSHSALSAKTNNASQLRGSGASLDVSTIRDMARCGSKRLKWVPGCSIEERCASSHSPWPAAREHDEVNDTQTHKHANTIVRNLVRSPRSSFRVK